MKKFIIFVVVIALFLSGCAQFIRMPQSPVEVNVQLDKSQYEIVGDIQGEAQVDYLWLLIIVIPLNAEGTYGSLEYPSQLSPFRGSFRSLPEQMAIYNAITSASGVDAIITPRFETKVSGFPPFLTTVNVKVSGKGIRIKSQ